jgi:hypothetical protein
VPAIAATLAAAPDFAGQSEPEPARPVQKGNQIADSALGRPHHHRPRMGPPNGGSGSVTRLRISAALHRLLLRAFGRQLAAAAAARENSPRAT